MWRDIGLDDWLVDMDHPEQVKRLVPMVLAMAKNPNAAKAKAAKARDRVSDLQRQMVSRLENTLG
jgi:hypothetical protein